MVVAEDVVSYFQSLKSYERIWIMCKLQHSCLPFELRFLGTCLEELGRKDFNHLRPVENEANSNAEINISELRKISDKDVQPKIILYLSLLHSHNYACSNSLYKILCDSNEVNTFLKYEDEREDSFEQLLMIYTLAVNHPAFSCEQKRVLLSIFSEIQGEESKRTSSKDGVRQPSVDQSDNPSFTSTIQVQECQSQISTPPENTVIAQSLPNPSHIATIPPPYTAHDLSIPVHEQIGMLPAHSYVRFLPPTSWSGATAIPGVGIVLTTSEQTTTTHTPFLSRSSSPSISNAPSRSSSPSAKARPLSAPFARSPQLAGILPPQPASLPLPQTTVDPFVEMIHKDSSPLPVNAPTYPSEQLYRRSDEELSALGMTEDSIQSLRCMVVNNKRLSSDDSLSTPSVDKVTPNDPGTEALKEFIEKSVPTSYNVYTAAIPGAVDPNYQVTHPYVCVYCNPNNGQPLNGFVAPANAEISCLEHDMNVLRLEADVPSRNSNGSNSDSNSSEHSSPPNTPVLPQNNNFNKRSNKHNANNEYGVNNNHNNNNNNNNNNNSNSNNNNNNNNIDERSNAGDSSSEERHSAPHTSYQARGRIINNRGRSKNQNTFPRGRGAHRRRHENMNGNNEEVKKPNYSGANAEGASFQYSTNQIAAVTNATTYVHPPQYLRCYNTFPANSYMRAPSHHHPYTSNEVIYHQYPPPQHIFPGAIPYTPVVLPASKVSCYNCGSPAHMANECRDSTLEELQKNGQYRLDFTPVEGALEK